MSWPPAQFDAIDTAAGLRNVGGDQAFYIRLLERFLRTQQGSVAALALEAGAGNWLAVGQRAHALRGSAAGIGAHALQRHAETLEQAVAQGAAPAPQLLEVLSSSLSLLVAKLDNYFSTQLDTRQCSASDKARALAARAQLDVMLSEFSGEANDFFDQCRSDLAAAMPPAAMALLEGHVERYEFAAARALLGQHLHKTS